MLLGRPPSYARLLAQAPVMPGTQTLGRPAALLRPTLGYSAPLATKNPSPPCALSKLPILAAQFRARCNRASVKAITAIRDSESKKVLRAVRLMGLSKVKLELHGVQLHNNSFCGCIFKNRTVCSLLAVLRGIRTQTISIVRLVKKHTHYAVDCTDNILCYMGVGRCNAVLKRHEAQAYKLDNSDKPNHSPKMKNTLPATVCPCGNQQQLHPKKASITKFPIFASSANS